MKQTIAGLAARWRGYAWTVAGSAGLGAFLLSSRNTPSEQWTCAYQHWQGVAVSWFASGRSDPAITVHLHDRTARVPASVLANDRIWLWCWDDLFGRALLGGTLGALVGMLLCFGFAIWIRSEGKESTRDRFITGTQIVAERVLARKTRKASNARSIRIASVGIPAWLECRHFALLGTTGAGKTTVMRQMLDQVEARGEPALVYDTSGEFITHYYRPERGDIILNPFDERSAFWSPFSEIAHPADADRIARQLVSETGERDDDVWLETSRILVANVLRVLSAEGRTTLPDLLDALQVKGKEEMKVWLAGTSSARTFADDADRATGSVLFMLAKAATLLQFLWREPGDRGSFAFREFIAGLDAHQGPKPWLFVPRKEDYFEAMKPLLACWLECAASAMLGLPPSDRRRMWFFLDELADLPRVDNLTRLLPEGRKFGASVVLTFQAIGQMHRRYGRDSAEALLGCCNSKLYLQLIDRDTREWASRNIGDVEVEVRSASDSFETGPHSGRTSVGSTRVVRPAVIESDLRLQPHHGFLQLPDALPVGRIKLTRAHIDARGPARHPAFVPAHISQMLWNRMPKKADSSAGKDDPATTLKGPV
ncbi:type IV secretion system DNA-binding domain-containing protein [Erythrobacter oryzae]|uniref:type IV secretion system DNA-binding domain-containing protein n=1 Tax=Erythrobacter oryzae TaxID=3019556 RepID=UPI002554B25D|nr:type IV secretion system DNA-binding domain-containing protein [Erythrobacter sp. COR-2]